MTTATAERATLADTLLLNVALMPPLGVATKAIELSRELREHGSLFQLDGRTRFPHLTLYMARFSKADVDIITGTFSEICSHLNKTTLKHDGYFATEGGYYEVSYARTEEVLELHKRVTAALHKSRYSPGNPETESYFGTYTPSQRANARKWGYDLANELYRPHITLSRFKTIPDIATLPTSPEDLSFVAGKIALFKADSMGAARELVVSADLH